MNGTFLMAYQLRAKEASTSNPDIRKTFPLNDARKLENVMSPAHHGVGINRGLFHMSVAILSKLAQFSSSFGGSLRAFPKDLSPGILLFSHVKHNAWFKAMPSVGQNHFKSFGDISTGRSEVGSRLPHQLHASPEAHEIRLGLGEE
jgi:hypothetical protein